MAPTDDDRNLAEVEEDWLAWAWEILAETSADHLTACQAKGGAIAQPAALNPGYVGESYQPGGLLAAALVWGPRRGPESDSSAHLTSLKRRWLAQRPVEGPSADRTFLDAWRPAFVADQGTNEYWDNRIGWFVDAYLGLDRRAIAIANLAPCRMSVEEGEKLARFCQPVHDFRRFVAAVRPAVVVAPTVALPKLLDFESLNEPPLVIAWNGRTFMRNGARRDDWAPDAAQEALARLRLAQYASTHTPPIGPVWKEAQPPIWATTIEPARTDPDKVARGSRAHCQTLRALAHAVKASGGTPRDSLLACQYDLAWQSGETLVVAEVKSITPNNEQHQIRYGLGQVIEYRHWLRAHGHRHVEAGLVVECEPGSLAWSAACADAGVTLAWPGQFRRLPGIEAD